MSHGHPRHQPPINSSEVPAQILQVPIVPQELVVEDGSQQIECSSRRGAGALWTLVNGALALTPLTSGEVVTSVATLIWLSTRTSTRVLGIADVLALLCPANFPWPRAP